MELRLRARTVTATGPCSSDSELESLSTRARRVGFRVKPYFGGPGLSLRDSTETAGVSSCTASFHSQVTVTAGP